MAEYLSGSITFQGLGSGTDFGSIIEQLKKLESIPMQRMQIWKADWQARAEAFETVLQSMRDAKSALSLINSRDKFVAKIATSSKPDIASISATGKALDGAHSIEVTQLASNAIWSCGTEFEKRTSSIATQNTEFTYTYKGQTRTLQIAGNTGLESFVNMINNDPQNKGIRASIVQSGSTYRLQIQGKDSGANATLDIAPSAGLTFISESTWRSSQSYAGSDAIWGSGAGAGEFRYTIGHGGTEQSIAITNTTTADQLVAAINSASGPGAAELDDNGRLVIMGATSVRGPATAGTIGTSYWTSSKYYDQHEALTTTGGGAVDFSFSIGGEDFTVDVLPGVSTAQDLVDAINAEYQAQHPGADDVAVLVKNASGKYAIQIAGATAAHGAGIDGASATAVNGLNFTPIEGTVITVTNAGASGGITFDGWVVQEPRNAKFMLDNWPDELESTSNNITGVLDGVTITVFDLGKAQLSVATDTESVQQNIQTFLDAVNSVRMSIRELSKVDDSTSGYNFSVAKDDNSGSKQIGSLLTGNYGVQLLNSRMKDLAAGMPPGFQKIMGNDFFSGDLISSLSQIGIKTVSDKDDPHYGLLVVAPPSTASGMQDMDQKAFDEALTNKLDALLDFFACDDEGSSTSADFRYASHVKGGTKAGTYAVNYTVSYDPAAPDVPAIDVYIDGHKAARDSNMEGYWFTSANGPSAGLAIQIDNLNVGEHSGKVSIKQGKIREMEDFFTAETRSYDNYTHTGGALEVLKRNYANIMENIDKKIEREQTRIAQWEQRQKLAYSRLDTLLAKYNLNQQRLEKELAKLNQ